MADPKVLTLIQEDRPEAFNRLVEAQNGNADLTGAQFRGYDLRKFNLKRADLRNVYFRNSDLRGLDLSEAHLEGASLKAARVSGVMFPKSIPAEEIRLSLEHGTRLREVAPVS